jgi:hypothetical protein
MSCSRWQVDYGPWCLWRMLSIRSRIHLQYGKWPSHVDLKCFHKVINIDIDQASNALKATSVVDQHIRNAAKMLYACVHGRLYFLLDGYVGREDEHIALATACCSDLVCRIFEYFFAPTDKGNAFGMCCGKRERYGLPDYVGGQY